MVDKKTIGISSLVTLGIVAIASLIPGFFSEPKYYCEERAELGVVHCDSFSKYVAENGKCIRDDNTNLICRSGWILVEDDINITEKNEDINNLKDFDSVGQVIKCKENGCIEI